MPYLSVKTKKAFVAITIAVNKFSTYIKQLFPNAAREIIEPNGGQMPTTFQVECFPFPSQKSQTTFNLQSN